MRPVQRYPSGHFLAVFVFALALSGWLAPQHVGAQRPATDTPDAVTAMLTRLDAARVGDEEPNLSSLSDAERAALGVLVLARVAHPRGRQAGVGASIAYLHAARSLPQGAEIALTFLQRPVRRVAPELPSAFFKAFDALAQHERDGSASPTACAALLSLIQHPPALLVRGSRPALAMDSLAFAVSACPSPPLADIVRVCANTIGTYCDAARVRAGDPVRTRELIEGGLAVATTPSVGVAMSRWHQLTSAFARAGERSPIDALLPLLDSRVVLHIPTMFSDGPHASSTTYGDVGVADMYLGLAVQVWQLPVRFPPTPSGAMVERVYTPAERDEARRLIRERAARRP